jgi:hypothetical protein
MTIPNFVQKHFAYTKGCSFEHSVKMHSKLELYFDEVRQKGVAVPSPEVDEVWHNFILHTNLYQEYCLVNFGKLIHHNPKLPDDVDDLIARGPIDEKLSISNSKCDNQCNGGSKCDNQCNGGNKCDNKCNGN